MSSASLRILENVQSMARAEPEGCSNGRGGAKRYPLRMQRLATGGSRMEAEASRMVTEKVAAVRSSGRRRGFALSGGWPLVAASKALKIVKKRVRANKRRLQDIRSL